MNIPVSSTRVWLETEIEKTAFRINRTPFLGSDLLVSNLIIFSIHRAYNPEPALTDSSIAGRFRLITVIPLMFYKK